LTREDFVGVFRNAVAGIGLAPEAAAVTFPIDLFLADSDLAPLGARKQAFYDGLTTWRPSVSANGGAASRILRVEGATQHDAMVKANHLFLANRWGDGLPLWPATEASVAWMLQGSDLPRGHFLGRFPPRGGGVTVETCAIALTMAGGRPEYLPVLLGTVEAMLDPAARSDLLQAASGSAFPVVIVNGPIGRQIRLNSGFGCLGPDPQRPAGASIGRALRLLQQNVGGALPGNGAMGIFGAMRYTNAVFAEDEEGLPEAWLPHGSERHGFARGTSSVSLVHCSGVTNVKRRGGAEVSAAEEVLHGLHRVADFMRTPNLHAIQFDGYESGTPGIVMMSRVTAGEMAEQGFGKAAVREFLWTHSRIPLETFRRSGNLEWIRANSNAVTRASADLDPWPICSRPDNLVIVVAGGEHPTNSYWLQGYCPEVVGREIRVPATLDRLLAQADRDLGCASEVCST
jgi:hypothetical protein